MQNTNISDVYIKETQINMNNKEQREPISQSNTPILILSNYRWASEYYINCQQNYTTHLTTFVEHILTAKFKHTVNSGYYVITLRQ